MTTIDLARVSNLRLINKTKRSKWYKVFVTFEWEDRKEIARFLHAGDAYAYACKLQDDSPSYAERLDQIDVEC